MRLDDLINILSAVGVSEDSISIRRDGQIQIPCPLAPWFHKGKTDSKPSLSIKYSDDKPTVFKCFSCLEKGKLWNLVESIGVLKPEPKLRELAQKLITEDRPTLTMLLNTASKDLLTWVKKPIHERISISSEALTRMPPVGDFPWCREYLSRREISPDLWAKFNLRYDHRGHRIVFPVIDSNNRFVGGVGRLLPEYDKSVDPSIVRASDPPKYKNYLGFVATNSLGGENLFNLEHTRLVVVEGYFCLMRGFSYAHKIGADICCTWHAEMSEEQATKIISLDKPVYVFYNNDDAGNKGWKVAVNKLYRKVPALRRAVLAPTREDIKEDVGGMTETRFLELFEAARRS